jgi:arylsulfatase
MINRRDFLKRSGFAAAAFAGLTRTSPAARHKERPNILFITTDYQAGDDGPTLGSPFLDMPALKRLCDDGVVFKRHYSTSPICIPARFTWISGMYPHYHGNWDNYGIWLKEGTPILMEELVKSGYQTLGIGKMHFSPWDRLAGFQRRIIADCKGASSREDDYGKFLKSKGFKYNRLEYCPLVKWEMPEVYDWQWDESLHIDAFVGDNAVEVIEKDQLKGPWFMWVSFNGPHNPWNPPAKYSDQYKKMDLPPANAPKGELLDKPADQTSLRYNYTRSVSDYIDQNPERHDEIIARIRAGHFGGLTFIDRKIENILAALDKKDLTKDTIIIFSADHGCHLGDHHNIHKGSHYRRSAHVPFVVHCPARYKAAETEGLSSHVDLMPTLLDIAGAPVPESLEGVNLTPMITGKAKSVQDEVFIEVRKTTSIITSDWKLGVDTQHHQGDMYNLKNDPLEQVNLYDNPKYAKIQKKLLEKIFAFQPAVKEKLDAGKYQDFIEKTSYTLKNGQMLKNIEAPYHPGKSFKITATFDNAKVSQLQGPILVQQDMSTHGYALYAKDGAICFALRCWKSTSLIEDKLPTDETVKTIQVKVNKDSSGTLKINGKETVSFRMNEFADGFPVQPGSKRIMAGIVTAGKCPPWHRPMGDYDKKAAFKGPLKEIKIELS